MVEKYNPYRHNNIKDKDRTPITGSSVQNNNSLNKGRIPITGYGREIQSI